MADYFSHARAVDPRARSGAAHARRCRLAPISAARPTASGSSTSAWRRCIPSHGWPRFNRRSTPIGPSPMKRSSGSDSTCEGCSFAALFPTAAHRAALLRFLVPRRGLYARLVRAARLRPARPTHSPVSCDHLPRRARLLPQVHGRRAHASDDPQCRAPRHCADVRPRFSALLREVEAPELLVLALLLHDVGKWRDDDHAVESVRMAEGLLDQLQLRAGGARDRAVPDRQSSAHVAGRLPARHSRTRKSCGSLPRSWAAKSA